ncbi:helix-turn-helix transcriptional regulator [Georgenia sp. 311]|uniref:ArsR/SmtB family transcription factor n=1 Tax=Georgenia sp. 311 TaxID=2585134 RepID=UPI0011122998|nr:metalloregulator ArsR/SmtB family transcription factor [Georgenia sp. 311]TNC20779.1 helix-turn-helix transcriptional regulator [Georgenia sp. 311]
MDALPLIDVTANAACCSPLARTPLAAEDAERLAGMFKAVADPARLRLLSLIASHDGGEACVCDLTEPLALSQPTVSHHLKTLTGAGLITREQRGRWAYYAVVPAALDALGGVLTTRHRAADASCC